MHPSQTTLLQASMEQLQSNNQHKAAIKLCRVKDRSNKILGCYEEE